jgi:AraC family ethanolamine operon transcriptional activator
MRFRPDLKTRPVRTDSPTPIAGEPGASARDRVPTPAFPRTLVLSFPDFDAFSITPPVGGFEMVLTGPESSRWRVSAGRLGRSAVAFGSEGGANAGHARIPDSMVVFRIPISGIPPISAGQALDKSNVVVHGPGAHQFEAIRGPSAWATYAADPALLEAIGAELDHRGPVILPGERRVVSVDPLAVAKIRSVLARAKKAVLRAPSEFDDAAATARLERDLAGAFVSAVSRSKRSPPVGVAEERRLQLLVASMEYLGATKTHAVTLPELCRVVRTSARTLTRVFHDAFRISPARYLRLRRLGQVRAHLRRGVPRPETVTSAALRFGFSELGRFSVEYRRLFGESPSTTLRLRRDA